MGVIYSAAFDVSAIRDGQTDTDYSFTMTITGSGSGFGTAITVSSADFLALGSTVIAHGYGWGAVDNHEGAAMFTDYSTNTFAAALAAILNSEATANGWTGSFSVTFASNQLTIARATGSFSFTIAWGQSASRWLCGFSADENTPGTTFTGGLTPMYWIDSTQDGRSLDREGDYEVSGVAALAISNSATKYAATSRSSVSKYRSWWQHFEPVAKVHKARIAGTVRWTFEHLFEHCRCEYPFIVDDGVEVMACLFTEEGAVWTGKQRTGGPGDDVHMNVPFNVWHAGNWSGG